MKKKTFCRMVVEAIKRDSEIDAETVEMCQDGVKHFGAKFSGPLMEHDEIIWFDPFMSRQTSCEVASIAARVLSELNIDRITDADWAHLCSKKLSVRLTKPNDLILEGMAVRKPIGKMFLVLMMYDSDGIYRPVLQDDYEDTFGNFYRLEDVFRKAVENMRVGLTWSLKSRLNHCLRVQFQIERDEQVRKLQHAALLAKMERRFEKTLRRRYVCKKEGIRI